MPFDYMLRCSDGSYYVGSARNLDLRLHQHQLGVGAEYTRHRLPVELVWSAEYPNVGEAFFWEKRIQGWSRAKREALIRGDFDALPALAKKDFTRGRVGSDGLDTSSLVPHDRSLGDSGYPTGEAEPPPGSTGEGEPPPGSTGEAEPPPLVE